MTKEKKGGIENIILVEPSEASDSAGVSETIKLEITQAQFDTIRKLYQFPPLRQPEVVYEMDGGAHFDFSSGDIRVGQSFIEQLAKNAKLTPERCVNGILVHEIGHYMVFPRNYATIILTGMMIEDFFKQRRRGMPTTSGRGGTLEERSSTPDERHKNAEDSRYLEFIFQTYADMVTDTASVLDGSKRDFILDVRNGLQSQLRTPIDENVREIMLAYLHRQAGLPHTIKGELQPFLERMLQIKFLDPETNHPPAKTNELRLSVFQWGDIVKSMIEKYVQKGGSGPSQEGLGMGTPRDGNYEEIIQHMSPEAIEEAKRQLSERVERGEYKRIDEWLKEKRGERSNREEKGYSIGIGTSKGELEVDREAVEYYKKLASHLPLIVTKRPIPTTRTKRNFDETQKWRVGDQPLLALPHLTGGTFLPGLTRRLHTTHKPIETVDYATPHLLTIIDSSGSMPNPAERKSYAALAGVAAAKSYLIHGSGVGVINFSGESFYLPYSDDFDQVSAAIVAYQAGGTHVDLELLKKMLHPEEFEMYKQNPEGYERLVPCDAIKKDVTLSMPAFRNALAADSIDLLIMTDGGIGNLEDILGFLQETKSVHRGTFVLMHGYRGFDQHIGDVSKYTKVRFKNVEKPEDIPAIVMHGVEEDIGIYAGNYAHPH